MPTTKPGQMSMRMGLVCRPRAMKLTANTISTASISTRTNSPTHRVTAVGWSCTCVTVMPIGKSCCSCTAAARSRVPSWMMSPPLAIETPRATTCWPWWRTITEGGSL